MKGLSRIEKKVNELKVLQCLLDYLESISGDLKRDIDRYSECLENDFNNEYSTDELAGMYYRKRYIVSVRDLLEE